jgi:signal transduction histidine kinase
MMPDPEHSNFKVYILVPYGHNALFAQQFLARAKIETEICSSIGELSCKLGTGGGAILIAEEALANEDFTLFLEALKNQPPWSDIPIILLTSGGELTRKSMLVTQLLEPSGSMAILERPLRALTLVTSVQMALRARKRQYLVRDLIESNVRLLKREQDVRQKLETTQEALRQHAETLEKEVQKRTMKLQESIHELEAFSYSVSHDLRSPLRAMQGYANVLLNDFKETLPEEARDYLERIRNSTLRLDRLVQDVLAYSRVARNPIEFKPINLEELIQSVLHQYPHIRTVAAVEIIPPLSPVRGHEPSLIQCISNILSNAAKFSKPDRPCEIRIHTESETGFVTIWFEDNGIGIDPAHHNRIFEMFGRVHPDQVYEGTGIGLAIVKKAVERMGGKVGVDSRLGEGTRFWIKLPTLEADSGSRRGKLEQLMEN